MWSNLRAISTNFFKCPEWAIQPKRTTYILARTKPVRLNKLRAPVPKRLKRREYYYKLVEDTNVTKKPPLEVVLTKDVVGVGMRGEKIAMNMFLAYRDLLLPKLAVYATSREAQSIVQDVQEKTYSSKYSKVVENYLAGTALKVIMSYETPWKLEPWHIKLALRQIGILANENCISLPKEISGPNLEIEDRDFIAYIIMNKAERFPIRCRIYHWSSEEVSLNQKKIDLSMPSEALFPDEKETIELLQKHEREIKQKESLLGKPSDKKSKRKRKH